MRTVRSFVVGAAVLVAPVAVASPAAAGPPVGGCATSFQLTTVAALQALAVNTPPEVFAAYDKNGDGLLCNRFLVVPGASAPTGIAVDNTTHHRRL